VQYGQRIAEEEKVPVTLNASVVGKELYKKCGFKVVHKEELVEGLFSVFMVWEGDGCIVHVEEVEDESAKVDV
jgi:hypothetical protein